MSHKELNEPAPQPVLRANALGKRYRIFASAGDRLKTLLGLQDNSRTHWALQNVSFELHRGQCLGVIGDNGAGKSTLLKLLAGTLQPSTGSLYRIGRITAILELGAGFHPDFTGRENLIFGGNFIGLDQPAMQLVSDGIIAFSELGDAIDRPVKTYSSGMVVRLAFALVTAVQPEVLIIDEALAVGDQHFQKKCVERIEAFRRAGCTILFCSHSLYHVRHLCSRVLWLDHGQVKGFGDTDSVLANYETHVRLQDAKPSQLADKLPTEAPSTGTLIVGGKRAGLSLARVKELSKPVGNREASLLKGPDLVTVVQALSREGEALSFGVMLEQAKGVGITSIATHAEGVQPTAIESNNGWTTWEVTLTFPNLPLHSGIYCLSYYLADAQGLVIYDEWKDYISFEWISPSLTPGLVRLPHVWS